MRKILSIILILSFIFNIFCITVYSSEDSFVTKSINSVKSKIDIPINYTNFSSKITVEPNGKYVYLTWYGEDDGITPGGQISVTVDSKLRIISYNRYFYGSFVGDYKLSKFTSKDAEENAKEFLAKVCPEFYHSTKLLETEYSVHRNFEPYKFKFIRYVDDIPCYDNYIDVYVDSFNCAVSSFEVKWIDYDKIYQSKTNLSLNDASVCMFDKIGMVREYVKNDEGTLYVRYTDMSDGINYINAYTGNVFNTNILSESGTYKNALTSKKNFDFWYYNGIFDIDYAIKIVENNKFIPIDSDYVLTGVQYLQDSYSNYLYMVYDNKQGNKKTYIVDIVNGDIRYYDFYQQDVGMDNYGYDLKKCEGIAENFVMEHEKSFINKCKLLNYNNATNYNGEDIYYFNYSRYINNIAYDSNGVVVGVSRSSGNVVSVVSGWDNIKIPNYFYTVDEDYAFQKYIDAVGFELQYVTSQSMTREMELRPVYAPNPIVDLYVDGVSGDIIDSSGIAIDNKKIPFKDIKGDVSEEQILVLQACGIIDDEYEFFPEENILISDYLLWMCRAIDCVEYEDINSCADQLVEKNIITYDELISNKFINTETAIKYIISYLGYNDIAMLKDTFFTGFVDEAMISPDMIGYAAIAKGLKIFQGNAFMPKELVKRNIAAQILYNLISN